MRSKKKCQELMTFINDVAQDIEIEKAEHNHIEAINAMYNILIGKKRK